MRRALLLVLLCLYPMAAAAAEPFATATIDEADKIVPGQQVHVTVDVYAPDFFTSPPQFPLFEVPNALVTLPEERAQNLSKTIDGIQYSGIRRRYAVVPEIAGSYALPTIRIEFTYSIDGNATPGHAETAPVTFTAEGAAAFAARHLAIEQAFDRDPKTLKTDDALVRTITITAEDTQAMMPPLQAAASPGLTQYTKAPDIQDGVPIGRGSGSRRTQVFVYTSAAEGSFEIPAITYPWFDLDAKQEEQASLPAIEVLFAAALPKTGIAPSPLQETKTPFEHRQRLTLGVVAILAAASAIWFARGLPHAAVSWFAAVRLQTRQSHRYRLHQLRKTVLSASLPQVHAAFHQWARAEGFRTLHAWAATGDPALPVEIGKLESALFSANTGTFDRRRTARLVTTAEGRAKTRNRQSALPELNPSTDREPGPLTPR